MIGSNLARYSARDVFKEGAVRQIHFNEIGKTFLGITIAFGGVVIATEGIKWMDWNPFSSSLKRLPWLI